jgi:predicted nucleic acid-binding protein
MIYCDTSVFVAALTGEIGSEPVQAWLAQQITDSLAISEWVGTEFTSAIAMKCRRGDFDQDGAERVLAVWDRLAAGCRVLPIRPRHFRLASVLIGAPQSTLRSGDALHLAIVRDRDLGVATLDRVMADRATILGVPVHRFHI